jgi:UDP-glucuronate 4-epimerase
MALFIFTDKILKGEAIDVYNSGKMKRDFTYVDDIVDGFILALKKPLGFEVINLGNGAPVGLMKFIEDLEAELGRKAKINFLPLQPGDVPETYADIEKAQKLLGFEPKVQVKEGIRKFVEWHRVYVK